METQEQCVVYVESYQRRYQNEVNGTDMAPLLLTLDRFHCSGASIVDFLQMNTGWGRDRPYF